MKMPAIQNKFLGCPDVQRAFPQAFVFILKVVQV